jgi:hypothetical protein
MRTSKSILAGIAAGALGLALVPVMGTSAGATVNGSGSASSSAYLISTQAIVERGSTSGTAATYSAAQVVVTSGTVGVYGRPLGSGSYASAGSWNTTTGTKAYGISVDDTTGSAPTSAATTNFVAVTSDSAAAATVQLWQDTNSNGVIDVGENKGAIQTLNFAEASSASVTVTPAFAKLANGQSNTYTVSATVGTATLQQDDDNTAIGTSTATDWSLGSFYTKLGGTTPTGVAAVTNANPTTAATIASNTTAGTQTITAYLDPAGSTASATTAPAGAKTGTGSFEVLSVAASPLKATLSASATGLVGTTAPYTAPLAATTVTWSAQIDDSQTPAAPVAGAVVGFTVTNAGNLPLRVGTATTDDTSGSITATAVTNAQGVATLPVALAAPTNGNTYTVQVTGAAGGTAATAVAQTVSYSNGAAITSVVATIGGATMADDTSVPTLNLLANTPSTLEGTATNVFGAPVSNAPIFVRIGALGSAPTTSLTTDASGKFSYTVAGLAAGSTQLLYVADDSTSGNITAADVQASATLSYDTAANITPGAVAVTAPSTATSITTTQGTALVAGSGASATVTFNVKNSATTPVNLANTPVTATVTNGVIYTATPANTSKISEGKSSLSGSTNSSGNFTVYVATAGTGNVVVTLTAGTKSAATTNISATNSGATAASISIEPTAGGSVPTSVEAGSLTSMTATLKDTNGNGLAAGGVQITLVGNATIGGTGGSTVVGTTATNGTFAFGVLAGDSGEFEVAALSLAVSSVSSKVGPIKISAASEKSITITGSRTTVSGKPGVKIDGVVTGIEDGKTVIPYFRFPGETTFTQGSARPEIADGSFTWQRKTGKKFYAYVTNDDGAVTSNRVIIQAN